MPNINFVETDFKEILIEELHSQLIDGYPYDVSKDILIKDIVDIVIISMYRWKQEQQEDEEEGNNDE